MREMWQELARDLTTPVVYWQIAVIVSSLATAWLLNRSLYARISQQANEHWKVGVDGVKRVLFPLVALCLIYIAMLALRNWQHTSLLALVLTLLMAMASIRLGIYALRYIFLPSAWLKTAENTIASVVWLLVALHLVGFLPDVLVALEGIGFSLGKHHISLLLIVQAVVNPFGTQALAGYSATMRVENVFSLIFVSIGNAISPYVSQNLGAKKIERIKKGYHAALVLDICFAVLAFIIIESLHTQISSLFLGKDGTALAYQVSGNYMRWLGYFFTFMGIKMATDGVLRGLGIMRPFLVANMVNLAIRLSVALTFAPRFGIAFVWLAVPAGWFANFLISYGALRKSWPSDNCNCVINTNELL